MKRLYLAAVAALCSLSAAAQSWPTKPVKLVVGFAAGGPTDVVARGFAEHASKSLGQPVIVDNKPGAGGIIGIQSLLQSPPDGQTIMVTASNVLTEIPHVLKVGFDPIKDVKAIGIIARANMVMIAAPNVPAKDFKSFVAYAKKQPGNLSFASYSTGTISQYTGMILNQKAGLDFQHVPFQGSPPGLAQVMGGQIPVMFDGFATSRTLIATGKVQAYAVASKARLSQLPEVPTFTELGYPDIDFSNWLGVVASATMPAELQEKIHKAVRAVAANPKFRGRMFAAGFEAAEDWSIAQLTQSVRADFERNGAIVKQFNIRLNQ